MIFHYLPPVICFSVFFYNIITPVMTENTTIYIPINKTTTPNNKEVYSKFMVMKSLMTIQIDFGDINKNLSFIIFQAHSHIYNVVLSNHTSLHPNLTGTNVGLYSDVRENIQTFYIRNPNNFELQILISVHGYNEEDPIPGGCNMEWPEFNISPYLRVTLNAKDYAIVDTAAAKNRSDNECNHVAEVNFYRYYLPEKNFNSETYFEALRNMMTLDKIDNFGHFISRSASYWEMRRMVSAYPGTGVVFVAVATLEDPVTGENFNAVYVPTHTYFCSPDNVVDCEMLDDLFSRILCALLVFIGTFVCFFGHRFFKTMIFITATLSGFIVTYIVIILNNNLNRPAALSSSLVCGSLLGALWLVFWYLYGIPIVVLSLSALNLGFFFASFVYFMLPGNTELLEHDANFWSFFIILMILIAVGLILMTPTPNIAVCAILGGYAIVYPIDCYVGTNLRYIIVNVVRRAVVQLFNKAIIEPPIQWKDVLIGFIWIALTVSGMLFQIYHNRGRSPYPPPPRAWRLSRQIPDAALGDPRVVRYGSDIASRLSLPPNAPRADERTPLLA